MPRGNPGQQKRLNKAPIERFFDKVEITTSCWLWHGTVSRSGYGSFSIRNRDGRSHRFTYELFIGPLPSGLEIDHLCKVRNCVNPEHLEAVSHRENLLRGSGIAAINSQKTACVHGHEYNDMSTYTNSLGERRCRICKRIQNNSEQAKQVRTRRRYLLIEESKGR